MGSAIPAGWVAIHVGFYRRALEIDAMTVPLAHTVHDGRWLVLGFAGSSSAGQSNRLEKLARQMMRCSRRTCGRCGRRTRNGAHGAWCAHCAALRRMRAVGEPWTPHLIP